VFHLAYSNLGTMYKITDIFVFIMKSEKKICHTLRRADSSLRRIIHLWKYCMPVSLRLKTLENQLDWLNPKEKILLHHTKHQVLLKQRPLRTQSKSQFLHVQLNKNVKYKSSKSQHSRDPLRGHVQMIKKTLSVQVHNKLVHLDKNMTKRCVECQWTSRAPPIENLVVDLPKGIDRVDHVGNR
jgi:hypothetical protein